MTKNQKIALGCGGAGCLGLIVVVLVAAVLYFFSLGRLPTRNSNGNSDFNANSNSNRSSDSNRSTNEDSSTPSTSMSVDNQHKLFQAVAATNDTELMHRVWKKLGLMSSDNTPNDRYAEFAKDHIVWLFKNSDFLQEVNTPQKARAYVERHIDD